MLKLAALTYVQPQVDGEPTDYNQITSVLEAIASEISKAGVKRDKIKNKAGQK